MTTALDIITQAMKKSGVLGLGQTLDSSDTGDALLDLNDLLAQMRRQRYLVYHLINIGITSTGATSYTVGPSADFNISTRPDRIESGFLRLLNSSTNNPVDLPLDVSLAREDYDRIRLKSLNSLSYRAFYDPVWPTGVVYPYPIPSASIYGIYLTFKDVLQQFASLSTAVSLPPEYLPALKFNLAVRLRQAYGKGLRPDPELDKLAAGSLNVIRLANVQVPRLTMPRSVQPWSSGYDYHSDTPGP